MWVYQNTSGEIIEKKDTLQDIFLAFLTKNKETIEKLGGTDFSVNFYKDPHLRFYKHFFVVLDTEGIFQYDWIFTRVTYDVSLNPSNHWVLDFLAFGKITSE